MGTDDNGPKRRYDVADDVMDEMVQEIDAVGAYMRGLPDADTKIDILQHLVFGIFLDLASQGIIDTESMSRAITGRAHAMRYAKAVDRRDVN